MYIREGMLTRQAIECACLASQHTRLYNETAPSAVLLVSGLVTLCRQEIAGKPRSRTWCCAACDSAGDQGLPSCMCGSTCSKLRVTA